MSLQEIKGDLDGPPCHVCGAIMVPTQKSWSEVVGNETGKTWKCLSCGTTTGCS